MSGAKDLVIKVVVGAAMVAFTLGAFKDRIDRFPPQCFEGPDLQVMCARSTP